MSDPVLGEIIASFVPRMPRFVDKHSASLFVADEQMTRGGFISALYEYDKSLKFVARRDFDDAYHRLAKLAGDAYRLNHFEYSHFVTTSTEQSVSGKKTFRSPVVMEGEVMITNNVVLNATARNAMLTIANGNLRIASPDRNHGVIFPDGTHQYSAFPRAVYSGKEAVGVLKDANVSYPLSSVTVAASSKKSRIKISASAGVKGVADVPVMYTFSIRRNDTEVLQFHEFTGRRYERHTASFVHVDTPATTEKVTYSFHVLVNAEESASIEMVSLLAEEIGPEQ